MTIPYFGGSAVAFLPLQNVTTDYQDIITSASVTNLTTLLRSNIDPTIKAGYQAQSNILLDLYKSPHAAVEEVAWEGGNTVCVAMIRPLSRGSILINTTDPTKPPVLNFGTFSHSTDLEVAVHAVEKVRDWMASSPMQDVGAYETFPGTNVSSDDEIADALRQAAVSSWQHPTSTCSMLKRELRGVVDSELRVYGVKSLRIVDASIFPMAVAGHTSSTVYAVAEKVSLAFILIDVMDCVLTNDSKLQAADIIKAAQK
jgi:choline dehydrogenase-like flavoprotein